MHNVVTGLALRVRAPDRPRRVTRCGSRSSAAARAGSTSRSCCKRLDPAHEVVVYERNAPDDTFGFGVVFSDETLAAFEAADPETLRGDHAAVRALERDRHPLPRRGDHARGGHGFCGARPQASCSTSCSSARGRARRRAALPHRGAGRRARRATWSSPPTASTARCATRYAEHFGPSLDRRQRDVHVARHRPRLRRVHVPHRRDRARRRSRSTRYPYGDRDEHVHRRDRRGDVARAGSTRRGRCRRAQRRGSIALRGAVRRRARRPPADREQLAAGSTS